MTVEFPETPELRDPRWVCRLLTYAFDEIAPDYRGAWNCAIVLADSATTSRLHDEFFGDPGDTDVMSFPSGDDVHGAGGYLGDIAISSTVAAVQAGEQGHSLEREVAYLALHGLLHLLGWDDADQEQRQGMLKLQDRLLLDYENSTGSAR